MAAAVTMSRVRIKLAHELRDETLRVEGPRRRALEEFATTAVVERAHVHMISSCEQKAADARVHRREAPQETENR